MAVSYRCICVSVCDHRLFLPQPGFPLLSFSCLFLPPFSCPTFASVRAGVAGAMQMRRSFAAIVCPFLARSAFFLYSFCNLCIMLPPHVRKWKPHLPLLPFSWLISLLLFAFPIMGPCQRTACLMSSLPTLLEFDRDTSYLLASFFVVFLPLPWPSHSLVSHSNSPSSSKQDLHAASDLPALHPGRCTRTSLVTVYG